MNFKLIVAVLAIAPCLCVRRLKRLTRQNLRNPQKLRRLRQYASDHSGGRAKGRQNYPRRQG